jgi:hypothetical protein
LYDALLIQRTYLVVKNQKNQKSTSQAPKAGSQRTPKGPSNIKDGGTTSSGPSAAEGSKIHKKFWVKREFLIPTVIAILGILISVIMPSVIQWRAEQVARQAHERDLKEASAARAQRAAALEKQKREAHEEKIKSLNAKATWLVVAVGLADGIDVKENILPNTSLEQKMSFLRSSQSKIKTHKLSWNRISAGVPNITATSEPDQIELAIGMHREIEVNIHGARFAVLEKRAADNIIMASDEAVRTSRSPSASFTVDSKALARLDPDLAKKVLSGDHAQVSGEIFYDLPEAAVLIGYPVFAVSPADVSEVLPYDPVHPKKVYFVPRHFELSEKAAKINTEANERPEE